MSSPPAKLLDRVRATLRTRHYSIRTEQAYLDWIRRFILFHHKRHPDQMGQAEIEAFLTHLAVERDVAASTQNQALSALLFLYREVLRKEVHPAPESLWARKPKRLPTVLTPAEVRRLLDAMPRGHLLFTSLLYGSGLRLMEGLRLRVRDLDFARLQIIVRDAKGDNDRATILPQSLAPDLQAHLRVVRLIHAQDLEQGLGAVYLPHALARKYPAAAREWIWQYVFPAPVTSEDPRSGRLRRHHIDPGAVQRAVRDAARQARLEKHVTPHPAPFLRHSLALQWIRHPNRPGTPRPQGRQDNHDLHPYPPTRRPRRP